LDNDDALCKTRRNRSFGKAHPDVPADLPQPYRLALKCRRGEPQPQVVALMDGSPRLLQGGILAPAENIECADRGVSISPSEQKGEASFPRRARGDGFRLVPPGTDEGVVIDFQPGQGFPRLN